MWKQIAIAAAALAASACSFTEQRDVAEAEVQRFHRLFNQRQAERLYAEASDELKRITQQEDFVRLLGDLHDQFGTVREANRQSWNVNSNNGRTTVVLGYDTRFERGQATEEFTYRMANGRPILVTYRINSDGEQPAGNAAN